MPEYQVDIYTPKNAGDYRDPRLCSALSLIRRGIYELRNMNGVENVMSQSNIYTVNPLNFDHQMGPPQSPFFEFWRYVEGMRRQPFLLAALAPNGGIVGALEGRKYTYAGTGDEAIFVNWVVVDRKYRKQGVGSSLCKTVESMGRAEGIELLMGGINRVNTPSQALFTRAGFVREKLQGDVPSGCEQGPFKTPNGAYVPSYKVHGTDAQGNEIKGYIDVWSKRLK